MVYDDSRRKTDSFFIKHSIINLDDHMDLVSTITLFLPLNK